MTIGGGILGQILTRRRRSLAIARVRSPEVADDRLGVPRGMLVSANWHETAIAIHRHSAGHYGPKVKRALLQYLLVQVLSGGGL